MKINASGQAGILLIVLAAMAPILLFLVQAGVITVGGSLLMMFFSNLVVGAICLILAFVLMTSAAQSFNTTRSLGFPLLLLVLGLVVFVVGMNFAFPGTLKFAIAENAVAATPEHPAALSLWGQVAILLGAAAVLYFAFFNKKGKSGKKDNGWIFIALAIAVLVGGTLLSVSWTPFDNAGSYEIRNGNQLVGFVETSCGSDQLDGNQFNFYVSGNFAKQKVYCGDQLVRDFSMYTTPMSANFPVSISRTSTCAVWDYRVPITGKQVAIYLTLNPGNPGPNDIQIQKVSAVGRCVSATTKTCYKCDAYGNSYPKTDCVSCGSGACNDHPYDSPAACGSSTPQGSCGDGTCAAPENCHNCPTDCSCYCSSGLCYTCNLVSGSYSCGLKDGNSCSENWQCAGGSCVSGKCGVACKILGYACASSTECCLGLSCQNLICLVPQGTVPANNTVPTNQITCYECLTSGQAPVPVLRNATCLPGDYAYQNITCGGGITGTEACYACSNATAISTQVAKGQTCPIGFGKTVLNDAACQPQSCLPWIQDQVNGCPLNNNAYYLAGAILGLVVLWLLVRKKKQEAPYPGF